MTCEVMVVMVMVVLWVCVVVVGGVGWAGVECCFVEMSKMYILNNSKVHMKKHHRVIEQNCEIDGGGSNG